MVRGNGCFRWLSTANSKREDDEDDDCFERASISSRLSKTQRIPPSPKNEEQRTESPSIPKEHDEFLEMIFPAGRQRSRTLTPSTRSRDGKFRHDTGSLFRDRSNTSVSVSGKRYTLHSNDLMLLDMVPATPDIYRKELSATLPVGRWSSTDGGLRDRRRDDWPEYVWRLSQKRLESCHCCGCEITVPRPYKSPVTPRQSQLARFFDNESYYNTHDFLRNGGEKEYPEYDRPTSRQASLSDCESFDVPRPRRGSANFARVFEQPTSDRYPPYDRPRCQRADTRGKFLPSCRRSLETSVVRFVRESSFVEDGVPEFTRRRHTNQFVQEEEKQEGPRGAVESCSIPTKASWKRGAVGRRSQFGPKCFTCEVGPENPNDDWFQMEFPNAESFAPRQELELDEDDSGYVHSDSGYVLSDTTASEFLSGRPPGVPSTLDQQLNRYVPSNLVHGKDRISCIVEDDYLLPSPPNTSRTKQTDKVDGIEFRRDGRYLPMNRRTSWLSSDPKEVEIRETSSAREKSTETVELRSKVDEEAQVHSIANDGNSEGKGVGLAQETEESVSSLSAVSSQSEFEEKNPKGPTSSEGPDNQPNNPIEGLVVSNQLESENNLDDATMNGCLQPSDNRANCKLGRLEPIAEVEIRSVQPTASQTVSQMNLLLMSPPPQCSFMVDHTYLNDYEVKTPASLRRSEAVCIEECAKDAKELCGDSDNDDTSGAIYTTVRRKSKPGYKYLQPTQSCRTYYKQGISSHPALNKRGNDYCHTYFPTVSENMAVKNCKAI